MQASVKDDIGRKSTGSMHLRDEKLAKEFTDGTRRKHGEWAGGLDAFDGWEYKGLSSKWRL